MKKNNMPIFKNYAKYSRDDVWEICYPGTKRPKGGNWDTGYTKLKAPLDSILIVFMNIGTPGLTGHDFPNNYDIELNEVTWYGKPNTHSDQPLMRELIKGKVKPFFFARCDNKVREFNFLGEGVLKSFKDNIKVPSGIPMSSYSTIEFKFAINDSEQLTYNTKQTNKLQNIDFGKSEYEIFDI